jgi:long-chain acyl-CoA synthetase
VQNFCGTSQRLKVVGVCEGQHIGVLIENSVDFVISYLAILAAGGIVVPIDPATKDGSLDYIVRDCAIEKIICSVALFREGTEKLRYFVAADLIAPSTEIDIQERAPDSVKCVNYTTGSTGRPKGVVLSFDNVFAAVSNIIEYADYDTHSRELVCLPLTHSFGMNQVWANLLSGGFVYLLEGFSRVKILFSTLNEENISRFPGTPTSLSLLMGRYIEPFKQSTKSLQQMMVNSSFLPPDQAHYILKNMTNVRLMVYYGLTEASRTTFHTHHMQSSQEHFNTVGRPPGDISVKILSSEERELGPFEKGEIVVSGSTVMLRYKNQPRETQKCLNEGRFHTGDLGYLDNDGFLFLTGRLKDIINVGGRKLSAKEVVVALQNLEEVDEAYVIGIPDELSGESPIAFVKLKRPITVDLIRKNLATLIESYKMPKDILIVNDIPRSETGKVFRSQLEQLLEERC